MLRTDCGTENVLTTYVQCFLENSVNANNYRSSHSNQRIENYWSQLKINSFGWIIDFFKDTVFNGELEIANTVHMEAFWFVFYEFIQSELDEVREHWNNHYIKKSMFDTVAGQSEELVFFQKVLATSIKVFKLLTKISQMY